jgi:hypothetical protein
MKFSDMMGKRDRKATEVTEPEAPEARTAPPVPEAPIRLGGNRSELDDAVAAFGHVPPSPPAAPAETGAVTAPTPVVEAPVVVRPPAPEPPSTGRPSIHEVVAELAPRTPSAVTDQQLDASAWLDGINTVDDDLLPH